MGRVHGDTLCIHNSSGHHSSKSTAFTMMKLLAIFALAFIGTASALDIAAYATADNFGLIDTNKDGAIDAAELVAAAESQGFEATLSTAAEIIKMVSGKDTVTLSDIQAIPPEKVQAIAAKFI